MAKRRAFGAIRRLPSGRWQASYLDASTGRRVQAPHTFVAKADASSWLSVVEADLLRGDLLDEAGGKIELATYAADWLAGKASLRLRTVELYDYLLRCHIVPVLGRRPVAAITTPDVRAWHAALVRSDLSAATVAKAYRLLRQIMESAVDDRLRRDNPCRVKGAAVERGSERALPSLEQVTVLADAIAPTYRAMVLLAAYGGLRRGESLGLARRHVDLGSAPPTVTVERVLIYTQSGGAVMQQPKTDAGYRRLALPASLALSLREHLDRWVADGDDALLFLDPRTGRSPTKDRFRWEWTKARRAVGATCSFHDLRHVAGTLNAIAGATTKEAMARLGHTSPDAALRYQHALQTRDADIAMAVERLLGQANNSRKAEEPDS